MTGEQFHDALTLLPADLIAQADKLRCRKPKVIPWKKYAALAACLAVLLCGAVVSRNMRSVTMTETMSAAAPASAEEAAAEDAAAVDAAPRMEAAKGSPEAAPSNAMADNGVDFTCVETPVNRNSTACYAHGPSAAVLTSPEELEAYCAKWSSGYQLDALTAACQSYDKLWFASNDLLLIPLVSVPAGQSCIVTEMTLQNGACDITIALTGEETEEIANYHILVPIEKGAVSDAGKVTLHFA